MGAFKALMLMRRYWPLIKMVLELVRKNGPTLDRLRDRENTEWPQDARDFLRKVDKDDQWDFQKWQE